MIVFLALGYVLVGSAVAWKASRPGRFPAERIDGMAPFPARKRYAVGALIGALWLPNGVWLLWLEL
jgi:hypothetical protein